jgi:hypothetical protein
MTREKLYEIVHSYTEGMPEYAGAIMTAVDLYSAASNGAKPIVSGSLPPVSEIETAALLHEERNSNNFKMSASDDFKAGVEWLKLRLLSGGNDR